MDRETLLKEASDLLAVFSLKVDNLSKAGYLSVNKIAEDIYKRLFNELLDLQLVNINTFESQNFPAIDLIDEERRIAFQITSDNSNVKVYSTLDNFIDYELYRKVNTLYIYSILKRTSNLNSERVEKILYKVPTKTNFKFKQKSHVIDNTFILEKIMELDLEKAKKILNILKEELSEIYKLFPKGKVIGTEIFITFSNENYFLGLKVIEGLISRGFIVYHNFIKLQEEDVLENRKDYVVYINGPGEKKIEKCLAILSGEFFSVKWGKNKYDPILKSALESNAEIFVYKTSNNILPAILQGKNILYDPIKVNVNDFQKIINDFSDKVNLSDNLGLSLVWYKKYESIINKVYPNSKIVRIALDEKRGFEIYHSIDKIMNQECYFICFHRGAELKPSCDRILATFPKIGQSEQKIVLLPRERNLEVSNRRKESLDNYLRPISIFFVEDFVINCISTQFKIDYTPFDIKDFVEPTILDTSESELSYQWLLDWFDSSNKPILVIKGMGGVGKSTLVQKLADDFNNIKPDAVVIYINSIEILTELERLKIKDHDFDLYYFYNAYIDKMQNFHQKVLQLDDETFRAALDSGNILFIIDGLDEVIAHFPQFNVDEFIKSTLNYSEDLGKGNILITCRSYFWTDALAEEELHNNSSLQLGVVSLQPFDDSLAQQFFEAKLAVSTPNRNSRIKKSMELAQSFINPNLKNNGKNEQSGNRYIPFVLSIINNMMEYEDKLDHIDSNDFETSYLSPVSKTDYITHGICSREKSKIGQISVNDQIRFFINLAISSYAGTNLKLAFQEFDNLLKEYNSYYHENARDSFKSHPLFKSNKETEEISFRYDFLTEYFKSIYISSFISGTNQDFQFGSLTIKLIANYVRINSGFSKEIYFHIADYDDAIHKNIKELIWNCYVYDGSGITEDQRRRAMSGLIGIAILLKTNNNPHIDNNTALVKEIFGNESEINDLHIIDYTLFDDHLKTVFDFSGLTLNRCTFDNYDYFWDCKFDSKTKFVNCVFRNLKESCFKDTGLIKINFEECNLDEWIKKMLEEKGLVVPKKQISQIKAELKFFLDTFILNGRFRPISLKHNLSQSQSHRKRLLENKKILKELIDFGIVEPCGDDGITSDKVQISKIFEKEVLSFSQESLKSKTISEVISKLALYM